MMTKHETPSFSPYDGSLVHVVQDSTADEVRATLSAAERVASALASVAPATRATWLRAIAEGLEAKADDLVQLADIETGLGQRRLEIELARTADQLRFYAAVAEEGSYLQVVRDDGSAQFPALVRVNRPLGPVAVFGASNFPLAFGVLGNDTASALAAGCPVVAKAHPAHPALSASLIDVALDALAAIGAPDGVVSIVHGWEAGIELVKAAEIQAVGFTGSQNGGLALWRAANEREVVIPVFAEMGTVNPVVLTERATEARVAEIVEGFTSSFLLGSGQYCTKPGLLLCPSGHDVAAKVARVMDEADPKTVMLTEGIATSATRGVEALESAGARVIGRVPSRGEGWSTDAVVLSAPAEALVPGSRLLEECFGPVVLVVEYADSGELRRLLRSLQGSLVGTVFTDGTGDDLEAADLVDILASQVGRVTVDSWGNGVAWTWAQQHGGPWPSTSAPTATSVGAEALNRWVRPVAFQTVPDHWLPPASQSANPWGVPRRTNGVVEQVAP